MYLDGRTPHAKLWALSLCTLLEHEVLLAIQSYKPCSSWIPPCGEFSWSPGHSFELLQLLLMLRRHLGMHRDGLRSCGRLRALHHTHNNHRQGVRAPRRGCRSIWMVRQGHRCWPLQHMQLQWWNDGVHKDDVSPSNHSGASHCDYDKNSQQQCYVHLERWSDKGGSRMVWQGPPPRLCKVNYESLLSLILFKMSCVLARLLVHPVTVSVEEVLHHKSLLPCCFPYLMLAWKLQLLQCRSIVYSCAWEAPIGDVGPWSCASLPCFVLAYWQTRAGHGLVAQTWCVQSLSSGVQASLSVEHQLGAMYDGSKQLVRDIQDEEGSESMRCTSSALKMLLSEFLSVSRNRTVVWSGKVSKKHLVWSRRKAAKERYAIHTSRSPLKWAKGHESCEQEWHDPSSLRNHSPPSVSTMCQITSTMLIRIWLQRHQKLSGPSIYLISAKNKGSGAFH